MPEHNFHVLYNASHFPLVKLDLLHTTSMFATYPQLAFPVPPALGAPGAHYWSAFHLTYPHPWFVATFHTGVSGGSLHTTWGVSSDWDLVDRIEEGSDGKLAALLCVMPPWSSPIGRWSSREVGSIWRVLDPHRGTEALVFRDLAGVDFIAGLHDDAAVEFLDRRLVVEISVPQPERGNVAVDTRRAGTCELVIA